MGKEKYEIIGEHNQLDQAEMLCAIANELNRIANALEHKNQISPDNR